ncbi:hypothetical protein GF386_04265 [Candidatus Pacearchaeota archaeon]|nr:hypothetical protein [Candidatus Pacearchaeota archaeon]MBD3283339.1 hypothetical protein [Candidatus Pacearchaeota archaeon]
MLSDYVLRNVDPSEYTKLKERESELVEIALRELVDGWRSSVENISVSLKYNPSREIVGIFLEGDGEEKLVMRAEDLSGGNSLVSILDAFVSGFYGILERELEYLRLPFEDWIDHVEKDRKQDYSSRESRNILE